MAKNKKDKIKKKSVQRTVRPKKEGFTDFLRGVKVELLKRVIWPTGKELFNYSVVVFSFVVFWAVYIGIWDHLFARALEAVISK